jgi:hypothetical protein
MPSERHTINAETYQSLLAYNKAHHLPIQAHEVAWFPKPKRSKAEIALFVIAAIVAGAILIGISHG